MVDHQPSDPMGGVYLAHKPNKWNYNRHKSVSADLNHAVKDVPYVITKLYAYK